MHKLATSTIGLVFLGFWGMGCGSSNNSAPGNGSGGTAQMGGAAGAGGDQSGGGTAGVETNAGAAGAGASCPLPTAFQWSSAGPVATPKAGWVAIKDFTHVVYNNQHIVYMTTHDSGSNWGAAMMTFADWPDAATAPQTAINFGVAPTLFYFTPKDVWVLAYQWGGGVFSYRTSKDPTNPSGWGAEQILYDTELPPKDNTTYVGPIDQTLICNAAKCYLYYAGDDGHIYKSSMPIADFPGTFPAGQESGIQGTIDNLFEAVQVYSVKGSNEYLMLVETRGVPRRFRAWTATDLEGPWTLLTDRFASKNNVTFSVNWTNDISHGDLVRTNPDETFTIDPCNLQLVFQGYDPAYTGDYGLRPYCLGLLTLVQ